MKKQLLTLALVTFSITALPTFAVDGKVYPGSMGVRWNASDPLPALNTSAIFNPSSTKSLRVDLPVIHDVISRRIKKGWVRVIDQHFTRNVRTQMVSVYRRCNGFRGWFSANKYSQGTSKCAQLKGFGALGSTSQAHYYYSCTIPPAYKGQRSGIVSYYAEEFE